MKSFTFGRFGQLGRMGHAQSTGASAPGLSAPQDFAFLDDEVNPPTFAANFVNVGDGAIEVGDYAQLEVDDGTTTTVHDSEAYDQDFIDDIDTTLTFPTLSALVAGSYTFRLRNARGVGPTLTSSWAGPIGAPLVIATAPAAFTIGMWSVADLETSGDVRVTITSLPADNGSAITVINYRIDGGSAVDSGITTTGTFDIAGLTDDVEVTIELQAVNAVGGSAWSDDKTVTPTSGAAVDKWALEDDSGAWVLEDDSGAWILESN